MNKTNEPKNILFITAHPDDETVSTGTFILARDKGWKNYIYHLTPGKNGKLNNEEDETQVLANRANEASLFSSLTHGKTKIYDNKNVLLSIEDNTVTTLVRHIRQTQPNIIILLHNDDYHFEHKISRDIALIAIENAARSCMTHLGPKITNFVILETDGLCPLPTAMITLDISSVVTEKESIISKSYGVRLGTYLQDYDRGLSIMRGKRLGFNAGESYSIVTPTWYQLSSEKVQTLCEFINLDKP